MLLSMRSILVIVLASLLVRRLIRWNPWRSRLRRVRVRMWSCSGVQMSRQASRALAQARPVSRLCRREAQSPHTCAFFGLAVE